MTTCIIQPTSADAPLHADDGPHTVAMRLDGTCGRYDEQGPKTIFYPIRKRRCHSTSTRGGTVRTMDEGKRTDITKDEVGIDIDSLLSGSLPSDEGANSLEVLGLVDRQMAIEVARRTKITTLVLIGNLVGPQCLPSGCEGMGPSFKLLSIRPIGRSRIAMFSVPVESEMAELFEDLDGRNGLHAIAYDWQGRPKEAYVL